ncbi:glycosyltransferase, partial [Pseudomonas viridiflava]|uniref:glycosyltransferase n=1 Tax=Pseudomonas viridiflava TaxID=33069 RepID=UPI000F04E987
TEEHYEIVVVDDGSMDETLHVLATLKESGFKELRILRHEQSLGRSTSIYHAALAAEGNWLATLDGDGQNDPADIPGVLSLVRARQERSDSIQ